MSRRAIHWGIGMCLVVVAVGIGVWLWVNPPSSESYPPSGPITAEEAHQLIQSHAGDDGFVILDVRTPAEFNAGHLSANGARVLNIDVSSPGFTERLGQLDREDRYLVYCRTGNRSQAAVERMEDMGFGWIYHMDRGVVAWQAAGLPLAVEP